MGLSIVRLRKQLKQITMNELKAYRHKPIYARDMFTGIKGLVTGHCDYLTGCDQYLLQPPAKDDGTFVEARWFDESRLSVIPTVKRDSIEAEGFFNRKHNLAKLDGPGEMAPIK